MAETGTCFSISEEYELPFLIPSALVIKDDILSLVENPRIHYPENGLYHLKNALVNAALGQWNDPVLIPFRNALEHYGNGQLNEFVESCAVYFLSCAIGDIRTRLREKMPDFGMLPKDYMAINMSHLDVRYQQDLRGRYVRYFTLRNA